MQTTLRRMAALLLGVFLAAGCGSDKPLGPDPIATDSIPPAAVGNLSVTAFGDSSALLRWTAPGDDGIEGQATAYEIRHSTTFLTPLTFPTSTLVGNSPTPGPSGSTDSLIVEGLQHGQTYYFALKAMDDAENLSELSNVDSLRTAGIPDTIPDPDPIPDTTPPAAVTDLRVLSIDGNGATLAWTAPGDDGQEGRASHYDLRFSAEPPTEATWSTAHAVVGVPDPGPAGASESFTFRGLVPGTTIYFALVAADEAGNRSVPSNMAVQETPRSDHVWWVRLDGSGDAPTIQAAIDSAADGDTVAIGPGTYNVGLSVQHKSLTLLGWGGRDRVTLTKPMYNSVNLLRSTLDSENRLHVEGILFDKSVTVGWAGGAILTFGTGTLSLKACGFSSNASGDFYNSSVRHGGAVAVNPGNHLIVEDCEFMDNYATADLNHLDAGGGAIFAHCRSVRVSRCVFNHNYVDGYGGGMGGALDIESDDVVVEDCEFTDNFASFGAAIFSTGTMTLRRCRFSGNFDAGGNRYNMNLNSGVVQANGVVLVEDCVFAANTLHGSALYVTGSGGISINRCTFAFNRASTYGSPTTLHIATATGVPVELRQTLIASNACGGIRHAQTATGWASCNIISGNSPDVTAGTDFRGSNENLDIDPLFCDPASKSIRVAANSPCWMGVAGHPASCGAIGTVVRGCHSPQAP